MAYNVKRSKKLTFSDFAEVRRRVTAILRDDTNNPVTVGYGHNTSAFSTVRGDTIKASDWAGIFTDLNKLYQHQLGRQMTDAEYKIQRGSTYVLPTQGMVITSSYLDQINRAIAAVEANPGRANAAGMELTNIGNSTRATGWGRAVGPIRTVDTITFASVDAARYFFNSGGQIRISLSHPNTRANLADNDWYEMLRRIGQISISGSAVTQSGNTGMAINPNLGGWYSLSTNETTILSAVNSGGTYQHTWFTRYNSITNLFQANDVYISIYKSTPTTANGPVSLHVAIMLNDEVRNITGLQFMPNSNNSAGTRATYTAFKAATPITNISTPTFTTTNFTSTPMIPVQPAAFAMPMAATMRFMSVPIAPAEFTGDTTVVTKVTETMRTAFSINNTTYMSSSIVEVSVPGETVEYCEIDAPVGATNTLTAIGRTRIDSGLQLELASKISIGGYVKVRLRIKTFERENWLVVEEVDISRVNEEVTYAYVSDENISSSVGLPIDLEIHDSTVVINTKDKSAARMPSIWEDDGSNLVPPKITSVEYVDSSTTIGVDTTTSAIGSLELSNRRKMVVIPSVLFAQQGSSQYFAKVMDRTNIGVEVTNIDTSTNITGKLVIKSKQRITGVSFTDPIPSRILDGIVVCDAAAYDLVLDAWVIYYTLSKTSNASFTNLVVNFNGEEKLFRDICLRNSNGVSTTADIYTESNPHEINSTEEAPAFTISTSITASGSGQMRVSELTKSFIIDKIEVVADNVTQTEWLAEGNTDGVYALKYKAKTGTHCNLHITSGARVYAVPMVTVNTSKTEVYIGRKDPNPLAIEIRHTSIVSVFPNRVMVVLTLGSPDRKIDSYYRDTTWSTGWDPAVPPKFDSEGVYNSKDEVTKEVEIPISDWTNSQVKDVTFMINFSDGLYCRATVNLLEGAGSTYVDLLENTSA